MHNLTIVKSNNKTIMSISPQAGEIGMDLTLSYMHQANFLDEYILFDKMYAASARAIMEGYVDLLNKSDGFTSLFSFYSSKSKNLCGLIEEEDKDYQYPRICTFVQYRMSGNGGTKYVKKDYYSFTKDLKLVCGLRMHPDQYMKPYFYKHINQWPFIPMKMADLIMQQQVPYFLTGKTNNRIGYNNYVNKREISKNNSISKSSLHYKNTSMEHERSRNWWNRFKFTSYFNNEDLFNNIIYKKYQFLNDLANGG